LIVARVATGQTDVEIIREYPYLTADDIREAIAFAEEPVEGPPDRDSG
jgi:uncharacterized protein (DUF433 family)